MGALKNMWIEMIETQRLKTIKQLRRSAFIDQAISPDPIVQCDKCWWVGRESQLISHQLFAGNDIEPADYEYSCPECRHNTARTLANDEICENCLDGIKYNDGDDIHDVCKDCWISGLEAQWEARQNR